MSAESAYWARTREGWVLTDERQRPLPGAQVHRELPSREAGLRERQRLQIHGVGFDLPPGTEVKVSVSDGGDVGPRVREFDPAPRRGPTYTQDEAVHAYKVAATKSALDAGNKPADPGFATRLASVKEALAPPAGADDEARQRARDHERVLRAARQRMGGAADPESIVDRVAAAKAALGL